MTLSETHDQEKKQDVPKLQPDNDLLLNTPLTKGFLLPVVHDDKEADEDSEHENRHAHEHGDQVLRVLPVRVS